MTYRLYSIISFNRDANEKFSCTVGCSREYALPAEWTCRMPQIVNPAETFGDIMVDYSYVECTSACVTALTAFQKLHPQSK